MRAAPHVREWACEIGHPDIHIASKSCLVHRLIDRLAFLLPINLMTLPINSEMTLPVCTHAETKRQAKAHLTAKFCNVGLVDADLWPYPWWPQLPSISCVSCVSYSYLPWPSWKLRKWLWAQALPVWPLGDLHSVHDFSKMKLVNTRGTD